MLVVFDVVFVVVCELVAVDVCVVVRVVDIVVVGVDEREVVGDVVPVVVGVVMVQSANRPVIKSPSIPLRVSAVALHDVLSRRNLLSRQLTSPAVPPGPVYSSMALLRAPAD